MDPNYGGGQDEQNWQFFGEGIESLYQQPQIPDSRDPCNSLNGSHFQSVDLGSQTVAGAQLSGNPDDNSFDELLQSISMDQSNQHDLQKKLGQTADSMEELGINQGQGSQTAAETQLLATITGDSDSQRNIGENSEEAWRDRKRKNDRRYREKQRDRRQALEDENDRLKQEIQQKDKQEQLMKSKLEVVEAENARLKCELEEKKQLTKSLQDAIGVVKQQQMSITNIHPLLTQIQLVVDGFASKVDEFQQNITQLSGTHVYAQPLQRQPNKLISQVSQAATTTQTNVVSPEFSLHQGQGRSTAVELQPFTQGLSDQDAELEEFLSSFLPPKFTRLNKRGYSASLVAENNSLKPEIQEKQELCHEDQQMKSNIEAFEAENKRLKDEIKEKGRQMKFNLRAFLVDSRIFKNPINEKFLLQRKLCLDNCRLERQIEEKERLMKSNMETFEAEKGRLKLEIGEKEQPMKSNLEAFEAQNERLKREIDVKKQLMNSNLEAFEAQNRVLEHEIQAKEQLVKSNLETLDVQIRQLVVEFESLNVANVSANIRTQTQSGGACSTLK